jgi:gliding motility-associated protein GldL
MNFTEIVESKGYKAFMSKLYGIGASVVIVGALFKIMHWPFASEMLIAGLGTEALIFFASAFEPPHETVDWSLVYPELAGLSDDDEQALHEDPKLSQKKSALEKFDEMINEAQISPELFQKLGSGLHNLNETTSKLSDLSDASLVTNDYVKNVQKASDSMTQFSTSYGNSIDSLNQSAGTLSESYIKTSEIIDRSGQEFSGTFKESYLQSTEAIKTSAQAFAEKISSGGIEINNTVKRSAGELAETYEKLTASMNEEFQKSTQGNKTYGEQLDVMGKNLTALNAVYEIQLQNSNEHLDASKELYSGLHEMMTSFKESANDAKVYREEVSKLGKNLMALNTIYGNMLSAMTIKSNE